MKRCFANIYLVIFIAISSVTEAADKIAVVNITSIFKQLPARKIVAQQLEDEFKGRANQLQVMERDLQAKIQRLQRESLTMKASERHRMEKDVMDQRKIFSKKAEDFEQENQRRQISERNKILHRIQDAINKVALDEGYDMIIDKNAIAYVVKSKDITAHVFKQVK